MGKPNWLTSQPLLKKVMADDQFSYHVLRFLIVVIYPLLHQIRPQPKIGKLIEVFTEANVKLFISSSKTWGEVWMQAVSSQQKYVRKKQSKRFGP